MKKIIALALSVLMILTLFAGCKKSEAAETVEALIKECPKSVTLDNAAAVEAAKEAYDALSDEDKELVGNAKKLEKAYEKYTELMDFKNSVDAILNAADTTFSKNDEFNISEFIGKYDELKETYGKMKEDEKAQFPDFDKLEGAVEKLSAYTDAALDAAAAYVKAFKENYPGAEITALGCIKQIRDEKEMHFFALSYKDKSGAEKNVYATARYENSEAYPTIMSRPDLFFADKPVDAEYDALANGNTVIDIAAAEAAAEALSFDTPAVTEAPETTAAETTAAAE